MLSNHISTDQLVDDFTQEMMEQDPEFVKESKARYLKSQIIDLYEEINKDLDLVMYSTERWWVEVSWETLIKPNQDKIRLLEAKLDQWINPQVVDYSRDNLEERKELALAYPITSLLNIQPSKRIIQIKCPLHADKTPSFTIYPTNTYNCFGCGENGNSITLYRKLNNAGFLETIKILSSQ